VEVAEEGDEKKKEEAFLIGGGVLRSFVPPLFFLDPQTVKKK
jgi:hypothetical protein